MLGQVAAVALADGAGSARHAEHGSRLAVNAMLQLVANRFAALYDLPPAAASDLIVSHIRAELAHAAEKTDAALADFACTLLFAAVDGQRFLAGQVGDGLIALQEGERATLLCAPAKGEFKNETVFVTSTDAVHCFVVSSGKSDALTGFALMSDGSADALYDYRGRRFGSALSRLAVWLDSHSPGDVSQALEANLREVIRSKSGDDCSLAVLRRVVVGIEELRHRPMPFQTSLLNRRSSLGLKNMLAILPVVTSVANDRTRVQQICQHSGLSRSTVYRNLRDLRRMYQFHETELEISASERR
jgi:hypothetical protein